MGRIAYGIAALVIAGLLWYLFRPEALPDNRIPLLTGPPPLTYHLHAGGVDQDIDHLTVRLHGIARPLDVARADAWWGYLAQLTVPKELVVPAIVDSQLAAYGMDGSRDLSAPALHVRWGLAGGKGYVWDGGSSRVFVFSPAVIRQIDQLAVRFDSTALFTTEKLVHIIVTRGPMRTSVVQVGDEWIDDVHKARPTCTPRVQRLLSLCAGLRLTDFSTKAPSGPPDIGEVRLSQEQGPLALDQVARLWRTPTGGLIQVGGLPAQTLDAAGAQAWQDAMADLERDYVVDLRRRFITSPLTEVLVSRAGAPLFRLEKHGLQDVHEGLSQWDVVWPAGREVAGEDAASRLALTLDQLPVHDATPGTTNEHPPADALILDFVFQLDMHHERIAITGKPGAWQIWGPTHRGTTADLPVLLRDLSAASMLDLVLIDRPWAQMAKIQRIMHEADTEHSEVYALDTGGTWRQTYPADARSRQIDQLGIEQLAHAACSSHALSARFITDEDRAILAHPDFELDVRFLARVVKHSSDAARLDETTDQDLGFCFKREGDGWRAVNREAAVSYLLNADVVDILRSSVVDNLVIPLVPSVVRRIEVASDAGHYVLSDEGAGWFAHTIGPDGQAGPVQAADDIEVRRLLRRLATLRAQHIDMKAAPLLASEAVATVVCELPAAYAREVVTVSIGAHHAPGDDFVISAETTAASRHPPPGRCYLPATAAAVVAQLTPPLASLLAAPSGPAAP
jgi:hypothetical protein